MIKKVTLILLLLLPSLVCCLQASAQYKLSYYAEAGFYHAWQTQVWDEEDQAYRDVTETYRYKVNEFRVWSYTVQVEYTSGAVENITLTPGVSYYSNDEQYTYVGQVMLNGGVPRRIRFRWRVGNNSGSIIIDPGYDDITDFPLSYCHLYPINAGDVYYHNTADDYHGGLILWPQIVPVADDKPINVSNINTACGGQTVTLKAPCMYEQSAHMFVRPAGATDYYDQLTWEVSEDLVNWKALTKYRSQIAIDENDYNDPAKKYNTPRYYRVKMGTLVSEASNSITFKRPAPSPNSRDAQSPQCYGAKGKIVLSDFRYPDGSAYTGQEILNFSIKPVGGFPGNNIPTTNNSITFDNLDPGSYEVAIVTPSGCSQIIPLTINPPPAAIQVSASPTCSGGTPALNMGASGGAGSYQYSIDNGNTYTTNSLFTGLSADATYPLMVKDANGCTMSSSVQLPAVVTVQATPQDPSSPGAADGSITLTPGGGAGAPYTYSLDNASWQSSNVFSGLAQGSYNTWAKDKNGCISAAFPVTLHDPLPVSVSTAVTQISCYGLSDGAVTVSASGGSPPFTYSMDGVTFLSINNFTNLAAGSYPVWAKDSKGSTGSAGFTVTMPPALNISVTNRQDALCKGMPNGQITVAANGGTGALQYALNSGAYQASPAFNVPAGQYTATVMDVNGCSAATPQVSISEPAQAVAITTTATAANCNGEANGSISVTASNGIAPYRYQVGAGAWQTAAVLSGLPAGVYTVNVQDNNGCPASQSGITITEPSALSISLDAHTDAACFNAANGSITVSAAGGTGNVLYYISTAPTVPNGTGVFTGLTAGDYTITAKDEHNCTATANAHIGQPAALQLSASVTDATCYGNANGSVTLQPAGGTAPYLYSADGISFGNSNIFNNLPAGNYTYYVKDSHGCTAGTPVTISQPTVVAFTATVSDALCRGSATGSITVTASGGVGPYQYNVDGDPFQSANVLNNIPAGTRLVGVMDANGCVKTNNIVVGEPAALTLQVVNQQPVSCFGGSNGSLTLQAGGGSGSYQYALNSGVYQASPTFNGLAAGIYTLTVKDVNGCTKDISASVTQPQQLSLQVLDKTDILCAGAATGDMQLQAAGGISPYTYSMDGAAFQTGSYYGPLPAGNYAITVRDNNGCTGSFTVPLVDLYPPLSATLDAAAPATCDDRGTITVTNVQGGLSPYTYSLDNANYTANPVFSNLYNGDYTVYIRDVNGCTITRSISPYGPVGLRGTLQVQPALCKNESNGSITVTGVSGGNNTYEYSLDGVNYQSAAEFLNLKAGVYQVHVRDVPYSCQVVLTGEVKEPVALTLQLVNNAPVSCFNGSNGALAVQANGGAGGYVFSLNAGSFGSAPAFNGLSAGNYIITVKDANSCTSQLSAAVTQPAQLTAAVTARKDISCFGSGDGTLTIGANGGVAPYTYAIDGLNYQSSPVFAGLQKGNYTIQIKDNNGCVQPVSGTVAEPEALQLQVLQTTGIDCFGNASGQISIASAGGTGTYTYTLNDLPARSSGVFDNLTAGSYLLSVSDENACTVRQSVTLQQPALLQLSKQVQQPGCSYASDGSVALTVSGGVTPYTYSWSNGAGTGNTLSNLGGGLYKVTVTDANGCWLQDSALLEQPAPVQTNIGFTDTVLCVGQSLMLDAGNPGASYSWVSDAGFSSTERIVQLNKEGHYKLTVTSATGCVAEESFTIQTSAAALKADFLLSSYGTAGDTVIVVDVSKPAPLTHEWTLPAGAREAGNAAGGTIRQLIFDQPGNYTVKMLVTLGECADMISKSITILPEGQQEEADSLLGYRDRLIKEVTAYPNPNDGPFKVRVKLTRAADVQLKLVSFNNGNVVSMQKAGGTDHYEIPFDASQLPQGVYLVAVEVEKEYKVIRVLKM